MQPLPPPNRGASSTGSTDQNTTRSTTTSGEARPPPSTTTMSAQQSQSTPSIPQAENGGAAQANKRRRHRGGKKKKNKRRESFIATSDLGSAIGEGMDDDDRMHSMEEEYVGSGAGQNGGEGVRRREFYQQRKKSNYSDDSLDSTTLLDHRDQPSMRPRRDSRLLPSMFSTGLGKSVGGNAGAKSPGAFGKGPAAGGNGAASRGNLRSRDGQGRDRDYFDVGEDDDANDRTPLISGPMQHKSTNHEPTYGLHRSRSRASSASSRTRTTRKRGATLGTSFPNHSQQEYDVNNPPSRPASPAFEDTPDVMVGNGEFLPRSLENRWTQGMESRDALIDIDDNLNGDNEPHSAPPSPRLGPGGLQRHRTMPSAVQGDVCFPGDEMSEMADDDHLDRTGSNQARPRRRRRREWPQLWALEEWSHHEKEARDGERRAKKISEPVLVGGRLRPRQPMWHREEEDAPYRYTYFMEEFESTIHAQTISELVQSGGDFRELFIPDPPEIIESSESSESEEEQPKDEQAKEPSRTMSPHSTEAGDVTTSTLNAMLGADVKHSSSRDGSGKHSRDSGQATPQKTEQAPPRKGKKYGSRPTFWLDVLSPTDQEMRVLCRAFGIHALTSEDIMMQEAREKVELFRNYYFINYRTFEQDPNSEDYLEPVNMYVCVFRHGILTFHFNQVPHPANVRRRIRQLTDYLILSADWISYAIIDDITDVYQPLITSIEEEVDDIDELILNALSSTNELAGDADTNAFPISMSGPGKDKSILNTKNNGKADSNAGAYSEKDEPPAPASPSGIAVLRRIGECRKKTTSLYRLLGQKADVIKGFAKRCNEQWEVAPRSEIGLYLGDIQDHIITMSSNLNHYETSLSRAHSNYLAQVNIRMGERQESTADILGKLTVIGTIVLPLNVICGMWGEFHIPFL